MKLPNTFALSVFLLLIIHDVTSFVPLEMPKRFALLRSSQRQVEQDLSTDVFEGFFEMKQIPTATSSARLDQIVDCSESGECSVVEMAMMIEELEQLNAACLDATGSSRECLLDAVAARNVLKVALASKVILQQRQQRNDAECDLQSLMNPYAELHNLNDECFDQQMHSIPTSTTNERQKAIHLDRIVECAEAGDCPVGEIADMIDELERLNAECESTLSRECSLDAVEARNILKVALGAQAAAARETNAMVAARLFDKGHKQE